MPVTRMRADVVLKVGHRVRLSAPPGEDYSSWQRFVEEHNGSVGTITGFPIEYAGPLDRDGRLPGTYYNNDRVDVLFTGLPEPQRIKTRHLVFCDVSDIPPSDASAEYDWAGELPFPIQFWPGDMICCLEEVVEAPHTVKELRFAEDGRITYILSNKDRTESDGSNLRLLQRAHAFFLYNSPSKLSFSSPAEELLFWSQKGLSEEYGVRMQDRWQLEEAQNLCTEGMGDLIVHDGRKRVLGDMYGHFKVCKIHPPYAQHRERIRTLALANPPPVQQDKTLDEALAGVADVLLQIAES